ncbi:MAG TPA: hypothetical protein VGT60_02145 [Candidatus Limnocylindria bacterium]|nr:hypothetical protein [Candidatus Limnocylindria bacterium]
MDEHELAWAAGFFDGDGWAALSRPKRRLLGQPQARINQSSRDGVPEVLRRFRDAVGVGRIGGPKIEEGREPLYWWVASSRGDVTRTGAMIGPWLSAQKRAQFTSAAGLRFDEEPIDSFAWAAGLFDAEGCVSLTRHGTHVGYKVIDAAITQGGGHGIPEELHRFLCVTGIGKNYGPYEQEGANEPIYRWRAETPDKARRVIHLILPWLGDVKRRQAFAAIAVIDAQPVLPRGRVEWGSHKTHCVHGHEYATARLKSYVSRSPNGMPRRSSKQCLVCVREWARRAYAARTKGSAADAAADP